MKVSPEARRLAKYKERKKEFSVATLQFDVTFCTPIPCASSKRSFPCINVYKSKKGNKDQELIRSSTTPDPGYSMGK